jgi:hypothetical protein
LNGPMTPPVLTDGCMAVCLPSACRRMPPRANVHRLARSDGRRLRCSFRARTGLQLSLAALTTGLAPGIACLGSRRKALHVMH